MIGPTGRSVARRIKSQKIDARWLTNSRMRRRAPFDPSTYMWRGVPDVNNLAFFENRLKGFGAGRPRNLAFHIDFAGRPYNTLTLPCEV